MQMYNKNKQANKKNNKHNIKSSVFLLDEAEGGDRKNHRGEWQCSVSLRPGQFSKQKGAL